VLLYAVEEERRIIIVVESGKELNKENILLFSFRGEVSNCSKRSVFCVISILLSTKLLV